MKSIIAYVLLMSFLVPVFGQESGEAPSSTNKRYLQNSFKTEIGLKTGVVTGSYLTSTGSKQAGSGIITGIRFRRKINPVVSLVGDLDYLNIHMEQRKYSEEDVIQLRSVQGAKLGGLIRFTAPFDLPLRPYLAVGLSVNGMNSFSQLSNRCGTDSPLNIRPIDFPEPSIILSPAAETSLGIEANIAKRIWLNMEYSQSRILSGNSLNGFKLKTVSMSCGFRF